MTTNTTNSVKLRETNNQTIDERIDHINTLTTAVKESFFEIAHQMKVIKDECGLKQKDYLALMDERTGYKKTSVYQFLRAHETRGNLIDFCSHVRTFPEEEGVIRPLATKSLNQDPELQAEIWEAVVASAGDNEITAKMVKDAVKEKTTGDSASTPPPPTDPPKLKFWGNSQVEKTMASEAMGNLEDFTQCVKRLPDSEGQGNLIDFCPHVGTFPEAELLHHAHCLKCKSSDAMAVYSIEADAS
ncbi:hypothetical protein DSCO28_07890 [Desulfosarcina ovata subsp. sediminis]|uniref:Uncharacterized protein n=1 Tax=Desulfosarcina ovata subsp. sediminis TaxID=885957 RepID=A0A5K7ZQZ3_9BACT|nr:hypothetical protein [Desulfosarcina ovata]BBO80223.1 hypothetical protein DSCO28_07890 [Desulfosarcina ovata subsp. sediminis]